MLSLRAFALNLYRPSAPPVGSAACLKPRLSDADSAKPPGWAACGIGFTLSNSLLIITGALVRSYGAMLSSIIAQVRRWNASCHDRTKVEAYLCGKIASSGGRFRIPCLFRCQFPAGAWIGVRNPLKKSKFIGDEPG